MKSLWERYRQQKSDQNSELTSIDRMTKSIAISLSRRHFLKTLLASGTILGMSTFDIKSTEAFIGPECRTCKGGCGCDSDVRCCQPEDATICYYKRCIKDNCTTPPGTKPWIQTCENLSPIHGCEICFW